MAEQTIPVPQDEAFRYFGTGATQQVNSSLQTLVSVANNTLTSVVVDQGGSGSQFKWAPNMAGEPMNVVTNVTTLSTGGTLAAAVQFQHSPDNTNWTNGFTATFGAVGVNSNAVNIVDEYSRLVLTTTTGTTVTLEAFLCRTAELGG